MRVRVIGGMDIRREDGEWAPVGALKQRLLLAMLMVDLGSAVPMDRLVDELWQHDPPDRPERQVHMLVWRLRQLFGDRAVVQTVRPGYRLVLDPEDCDVGRFEERHGRGQALLRAGDPVAAGQVLNEALSLWRGPAYADARSTSTVEAEAIRLDESRLATWESLLDAELQLGHHESAVATLQGLIAEHPVRERLRVLQMIALYRCGRQADALEAYQSLHRLLDEELGIRPGYELQHLHQRMLATEPDPELLGPSDRSSGPEVRPSSPGQAPAPAELPPDLASMVGRETELEQLVALASSPSGDAPVVGVIDGMAGVGKTALAVRAAHLLAEQFSDGQLYLDLHGFTEGMAPVPATDALDRLLRSIGVPGERIPADPEERAALWRTSTAHKRFLIILDNALSGEQIRPLFPGSASCTILVTSRHRLSEIDDAVSISLDTLPLTDAVALFRDLIGSDRSGDAPHGQLERAAEICTLPLALRLLASRLRSRPSWSIGEVVERLQEDRGELVRLDIGGRSVAAAFRMSYDALDPVDQRLFRLIDLHPGADFDRYAAAALLELDPYRVEGRLERLVDAHLLGTRGYGRYVLHDLVRAFAAEVAAAEEPEARRRAAIRQLLDFCLGAASAAMDAYAPAERHRRPDVPGVDVAVPSFADHKAALRWLDTERANLVALIGVAVAWEHPEHAWRLSGCLHRYFQNGSHH